MIDVMKKLGCIRHNGVLMTAEEHAAGYDRTDFQNLAAEAKSLGIRPGRGGSLRLQVHQARNAGTTPKAEGLARATAEGTMPTANQRGAVATALAKEGTVPAKPKATSATGDRVKIVAAAVEKDPALKGKAGDAINFLADPAFADVTGQGVVKLLKAGATGTSPAPASASTPANPTGTATNSDVWGSAIARMGKPPRLAAANASATVWGNVIGRMKARN